LGRREEQQGKLMEENKRMSKQYLLPRYIPEVGHPISEEIIPAPKKIGRFVEERGERRKENDSSIYQVLLVLLV
jgi:hypothetical protein